MYPLITYRLADCITFCKTKDANGGLSNMTGGYPIRLGDTLIRTSEHLYQAMRFPDNSKLQNEIIALPSPMAAKMHAKKFKNLTRSDWQDGEHDVRIAIMEWCLQLKLLNNPDTFGPLLLTSVLSGKDIVEISKKDDYWGAIPINDTSPPALARGTNTLGRLLWLLGRKYEHGIENITAQPTIPISELIFDGKDAIELAISGLSV